MTSEANAVAEPVESVAESQSQEGRILALLRSEPNGFTDEEMEHRLRIAHTSVVPRRNQLVRRGLVRDSEQKRRTHSGALAVVWMAVVEGQGAGPLPVIPTKSQRRATYEKNRAEVERIRLQDPSRTNVEIAAILGISTSAVGNARRDLEGKAQLPTKLDNDLERFDSTLGATASVAGDLARRLSREPTAKTQEELTVCAKNLSEAMRQLRALQAALKRQTS